MPTESLLVRLNRIVRGWAYYFRTQASTKTFVDMDHMKRLQAKRDLWGKVIDITSGYRCSKHNKDEGGVDDSQHPKGTATDIKVRGMTAAAVQDSSGDFDGLGRYKSFTHLDSRGYKARWGTTPKIAETRRLQQ